MIGLIGSRLAHVPGLQNLHVHVAQNSAPNAYLSPVSSLD